MAVRKTPAPSNSAPPFPGAGYLDAVTEEIEKLWQYAKVPLSNVTGVDTITATCDVALDLNRKGQKFTFFPAGANVTTTPNLEINGKGPLTIKTRSGGALAPGRLQLGRMEEVENDGTALLLTSPDPQTSGLALKRAVFTYQRTVGVNGGSLAGNVFVKYPFNTQILNEITGLSLNTGTNVFTLPALAYEWIEINCAIRNVVDAGVFMWNASDAVYLNTMTRVQVGAAGFARAAGKFTLAAPKNFEVHLNSDGSGASDTLGPASNITSPVSFPEQYGMIEFRVLQ